MGLSEHVLRAWERRYGVPRPERTPGGFRLYSAEDLARVRRMQDGLARGLSTAEAARTARKATPTVPAPASPTPLPETRELLRAALDAFDGPGAHAVLDALLAHHPVDAAARDVLLPYLHELGVRWASGEVDVAQEHFASNLIRDRLASLARPGGGSGRLALLACPPGELHDLPVLVLGVCLGQRGWRTVFLGADTPLPHLTTAAHRLHPDVIVLGASDPRHLDAVIGPLKALARATSVAVGGAGATPENATAAGALLLTEDPVSAAARLDTLPRTSGATDPAEILSAAHPTEGR